MRLLFGGGLAILPHELGTEEERPLFQVGLGYRIQPRWLLEARGTAATKVKAIAPASVRRVPHTELNLIWLPLERQVVSPYLTFGLGAAQVSPQRSASETKFAWNGGGGLELGLSRVVRFRLEGRVVGFQVPVAAGGLKTKVTSEATAGLSFGLDGKPVDRDGDGVPDSRDRCPGTPYRPLSDVGDILSRWPMLRIEISGHTDSQGSAAKNRSLSKARAQAVLDFLLAKFPELDPRRFSVAGYGASRPIASNGTQLGRARNRRVEFKVLNPEVLRRTRERNLNVPKE